MCTVFISILIYAQWQTKEGGVFSFLMYILFFFFVILVSNELFVYFLFQQKINRFLLCPSFIITLYISPVYCLTLSFNFNFKLHSSKCTLKI